MDLASLGFKAAPDDEIYSNTQSESQWDKLEAWILMIESKYSSPINILRCTISCNAEICPNVIDNDANSWNVWVS